MHRDSTEPMPAGLDQDYQSMAVGKLRKGSQRGSNRGCCCVNWMAAVLVASGFLYVGMEFRTKDATCTNSAESSLMRPGIDRFEKDSWSGDLRTLEVAWNRLCFGPATTSEKLRLAVFSKKWPVGGVPGGMERHALTLYKALAARGHEIHVYTATGNGIAPEDLIEGGLRVHFVQNEAGKLEWSRAWRLLESSGIPFDAVHSESVALPHWKAKEVPNLAVTWHGIAYEALHSELLQDLIRKPGELRSQETNRSMAERIPRLLDEIRFFPSYRQHVPISDYAGDVLLNIYQIPTENVHIILNGIDEQNFTPNRALGTEFRRKIGVPANATMVMGVAGRLVRDKGHPILFEAFSQIKEENPGVFLLVAGSGPWEERYRELAPNVKVLGAMAPSDLAGFYNALDIFLNPTLRPQGLDLTLMEAMLCGKPLLASRFPSITRSVIVSHDYGYTFAPNVASLIANLRSVIGDGAQELQRKGRLCRGYAARMFTATKMASAYERLFLCMKSESYCRYPLPTDCPP